jgi:hypothetical protein
VRWKVRESLTNCAKYTLPTQLHMSDAVKLNEFSLLQSMTRILLQLSNIRFESRFQIFQAGLISSYLEIFFKQEFRRG